MYHPADLQPRNLTPMRVGNVIYLDHQATTPVDPRVFNAMAPYFGDMFGNPHSADHIMGWNAARVIDESAAKIATLIGVDADEIIFTSGATEANNLALLGLGRHAAGRKRRRVLCSAVEHKCVLAAARALQDFFGYEVDLVPVDGDGRISVPILREYLQDDVLLVSIMLVNNEIGTIQDIPTLAEAVREAGAILHCDAAQAPCALDLSAISRDIDLLSLSAHKMYGPKGIGALYIRRAVQHQIEPLIYGGGQQRNLRSGTVPVPLCVGMGAAADLVCAEGGRKEREYTRGLRDRFLEGLRQLTWPVTLNSSSINSHPGNANVAFNGFQAHEVLGALQPRLAASTGSACATGIPETSHVLRAIGLSGESASASIRFSIGRYTTARDIDDAIDLIDGTLSKLREAAP